MCRNSGELPTQIGSFLIFPPGGPATTIWGVAEEPPTGSAPSSTWAAGLCPADEEEEQEEEETTWTEAVAAHLGLPENHREELPGGM